MILMCVAFVFGLAACFCPYMAMTSLFVAISEGVWAPQLIFFFLGLGIILCLLGFILRSKGSKQVREGSLPPGMNTLCRVVFGTLGMLINIIGLLYNIAMIIMAIWVANQISQAANAVRAFF